MNRGLYKKHILFITSSRIGDAVLSTGVLDYLHKQHPDAVFTIGCGPLAVSLFEGFPALKRIIPIEKKKYNRHWFDFWRAVCDEHFDIVVDLRNSMASRLLHSDKLYVHGHRIDKNQHKVIQNSSVLGLSEPIHPRLWPSLKQQFVAQEVIAPHLGDVLAVAPCANWIGKTWPVDRFIKVIHWMTSSRGLMPGASVAVFAAPGEETIAYHVLENLPKDRQINLVDAYDPGTIAAIIQRCRYFIGNDSGLMHCAAASGVPTMGLFGPTYPHRYGPWGDHAYYVQSLETTQDLIEWKGFDPKKAGCLMYGLSVDRVKEAIEKSWQEVNASSLKSVSN